MCLRCASGCLLVDPIWLEVLTTIEVVDHSTPDRNGVGQELVLGKCPTDMEASPATSPRRPLPATGKAFGRHSTKAFDDSSFLLLTFVSVADLQKRRVAVDSLIKCGAAYCRILQRMPELSFVTQLSSLQLPLPLPCRCDVHLLMSRLKETLLKRPDSSSKLTSLAVNDRPLRSPPPRISLSLFGLGAPYPESLRPKASANLTPLKPSVRFMDRLAFRGRRPASFFR
eukprot:5441627-Amphidinium_carterae.1